MPNFTPHLVTGGATGLSLEVIRKIKENKPLEPEDLLRLTLSLSLSCIGGILPDVLEPAIHPRHRKFFHSILFIIIIGIAIYYLFKSEELDDILKWSFTAFSIAIIAHIVLDGFTPAGLPVL
jgi:membrane-bound metal-dependent hydrolase YbcI (DUF457 family)